jgi:hypothetical protein
MAAMHSPLRDEQRKQIAAFLAHQRTAILSTTVAQGVGAIPVWYRSNALEVECLVPRWADVAHELTQDVTTVLLIVQAGIGTGLRWLQIQGAARPVIAPDWARLLPRWVSAVQPDALYLVVRVTPSRIDLIDEELGWGVQETLEW